MIPAKKKKAAPKTLAETPSLAEAAETERAVLEPMGGTLENQAAWASRYKDLLDEQFYCVLVFDTRRHCDEFLEATGSEDLMDSEWRRYLDGHRFAARIGKPLKQPRADLRTNVSNKSKWVRFVR